MLALQAWADELEGHLPEVLSTLQRALELGQPTGFVCTFADLPQLSPLLHELRRRRKRQPAVDKHWDAYLSRIVAAMHPVAAHTGFAEGLLRKEGLEPLTGRELDILHLLARTGSHPGTVKVHTANLYRKLGVENRRHTRQSHRSAEYRQGLIRQLHRALRVISNSR